MLALLVAMAAFQVLNHVSALRKNRAMVDHSHAVIEATQALFSLVQDAETGQRGYQLSTEIAGVGPEPSPEYLRPYTEAVRQAPAATARLRELAAKDSPEQQARIEAWTATLNDRLNLIGQRVELIRQGRAKENLQYAPKRGLAGMALARRQMAEIVAAEKALLDLRVEKAERTERLNFVGAVIVRVLAIIALLVAVFSLYRSNRRLSDEIRDREAAETARLETDALYRAVFEHSADYIFVINVSRDGVFSIAEMNPSAEDAVRADSDAVRGVDLYKLLPKADADLLTAYYRRVVAERRPLSSKDKMRWRGGRQVWESVLVPVFNAELYLRECLDSLVDQTLRDIEILCIDDGSTDSSPAILAEYASRDSRIRIITKPNSGYGDSMNKGIHAARGRYIGICEPDDFCDTRMFERLAKAAERHGCDIAKANYCEHSDDSRRDNLMEILHGLPYRVPFSPRDVPQVLLVEPTIWAAVYRREFLLENGIELSPTPGASFQDASLGHQCWTSAASAILLPEGFYHYRVDNAASSSKSGAKVFAICGEYERTFAFLHKRPPADLQLFGPWLNVVRQGNYLWNYNHISAEHHEPFAQRWIADIVAADDEGLLDVNLMTPGYRALLNDLLDGADVFAVRHLGDIPVPPIK